MSRGGLVTAAAAVLCLLIVRVPALPQPLPDSVRRGMVAVDFDGGSGFSDPAFAKELQQTAADLHLTWLNVEPVLYQHNRTSSDPGLGPESPSDADLVAATRAARAAGLKVMWKVLLVLLDGDTWVYAAPGNATAWFDAYGGWLVRYARLAAQEGVEAFALGTELAHLTVTEQYHMRWLQVVADVRAAAPGLLLTYGALFVVEYPRIDYLWRQLDWVGIDAYPVLAQPPVNGTPSAADLEPAWHTFLDELDAWRSGANLTHMPIVFPETGYGSYRTVAATPSGSPANCSGVWAPDFDAQANAWEALLNAVGQRGDLVQGVFAFELDLPHSSQYWDHGVHPAHKWACFFTPRGKPAYDVIAAAYAKPHA